jgi:peptidoglycan/xylan/chitin deacetylase (PgdA/CDA1 family)
MLRMTLTGVFLLGGLVYSSWATDQSSLLAFEHGPRTLPKIALTFDACPASDARFDKAVVDALIESKTPATFFLSGRWIEKFQKDAKKLAKNPLFELGQHGYLHLNLLRARDASVEYEIKRGQEVFEQILGLTPRLFRPPYAIFDSRTLNAAKLHGLTVVQYDLASGDPDQNISASQLERHVLTHARAGSVIVFHVNGRGYHTAEVLPIIIKELKKAGYQFVTVSELIEDQRKADLK